MVDARDNLQLILKTLSPFAKIDPLAIAETAFREAMLNYFHGLYMRYLKVVRIAGPFNVMGDFWERESDILTSIVVPHLTNTAQFGVFSGEKKISSLGFAFDNTLAHRDAAAWAVQHASDLVTDITGNNQKLINQAVTNYINTPGATLKDLASSLSAPLDKNPYRAQVVARTETIRSFSEGNNVTYKNAGIPQMELHAPLHPNCRCGERVVMVGDLYLVVWETDRDDFVCHRPINTGTSLGIVAGCAGMHDRVISEGQWFGHMLSEVKA